MCESPISPSISAFGTNSAGQRVDHHQVYGAGAHQCLRNLQRLTTLVVSFRSSSARPVMRMLVEARRSLGSTDARYCYRPMQHQETPET